MSYSHKIITKQDLLLKSKNSDVRIEGNLSLSAPLSLSQGGLGESHANYSAVRATLEVPFLDDFNTLSTSVSGKCEQSSFDTLETNFDILTNVVTGKVDTSVYNDYISNTAPTTFLTIAVAEGDYLKIDDEYVKSVNSDYLLVENGQLNIDLSGTYETRLQAEAKYLQSADLATYVTEADIGEGLQVVSGVVSIDSSNVCRLDGDDQTMSSNMRFDGDVRVNGLLLENDENGVFGVKTYVRSATTTSDAGASLFVFGIDLDAVTTFECLITGVNQANKNVNAYRYIFCAKRTTDVSSGNAVIVYRSSQILHEDDNTLDPPFGSSLGDANVFLNVYGAVDSTWKWRAVINRTFAVYAY